MQSVPPNTLWQVLPTQDFLPNPSQLLQLPNPPGLNVNAEYARTVEKLSVNRIFGFQPLERYEAFFKVGG